MDKRGGGQGDHGVAVVGDQGLQIAELGGEGDVHGVAGPDLRRGKLGSRRKGALRQRQQVDRTRADDGTVERIHQEDTCQALGIDPTDQHGRAKYESHGGPTLAGIAELLHAYAPDPAPQLRALLEHSTFNVVIGNADVHGKNISLLHPDEQHVTLAPLYDTVPTALWPTLQPTAASSAGRIVVAVTWTSARPLSRRCCCPRLRRAGSGCPRARASTSDCCGTVVSRAAER